MYASRNLMMPSCRIVGRSVHCITQTSVRPFQKFQCNAAWRHELPEVVYSSRRLCSRQFSVATKGSDTPVTFSGVSGAGGEVGGGIENLRFLERVGNEPCKGCGATLQCDAVDQVGYIPENKLYPPLEAQMKTMKAQHNDDLNSEFEALGLERRGGSSLICQRCFSLKYNSKVEPIRISEDDYKRHLKLLSNRKGLIVHVVDILDMPGSLYGDLNAVVGIQNKVILCVNKTDLVVGKGRDMPRLHSNLESWIRSEAEKAKLENVVDVAFVSAKSGLGMKSLRHSIEKYIGDGSAYFVGCTNAGKSSVVNKLISDFKVESPGSAKKFTNNTTVSYLPGTTISLIGIPYVPPKSSVKSGDRKKSKALIFDTPGIFKTSQLIHSLTYEEIKAVNPRTPLSPRTFLLKTGQCLLLGGLARIDVETPQNADAYKNLPSIYLTVFTSSELKIHATECARADMIYAKHAGNVGTGILNIPSGGAERMKTFPELKGKTFRIRGKDWNTCSKDIVLSGIGWVSVTCAEHLTSTIRAYTPHGNGITIRDSILPEAVRQRGKRVQSRGKRQAFKG
eukprot:CFRG8118T1